MREALSDDLHPLAQAVSRRMPAEGKTLELLAEVARCDEPPSARPSTDPNIAICLGIPESRWEEMEQRLDLMTKIADPWEMLGIDRAAPRSIKPIEPSSPACIPTSGSNGSRNPGPRPDADGGLEAYERVLDDAHWSSDEACRNGLMYAVAEPLMKKIEKTDAEWRAELSPETYHVTRQSGTEPFAEHCCMKGVGTFGCTCCGLPLFKSDSNRIWMRMAELF